MLQYQVFLAKMVFRNDVIKFYFAPALKITNLTQGMAQSTPESLTKMSKKQKTKNNTVRNRKRQEHYALKMTRTLCIKTPRTLCVKTQQIEDFCRGMTHTLVHRIF